MSTTDLIHRSPSAVVPQATPGEVLDIPGGPTWEDAFRLLARLTCVGPVSSQQVERWVRATRERNPAAADVIMETFNTHRTQWDQDMMG